MGASCEDAFFPPPSHHATPPGHGRPAFKSILDNVHNLIEVDEVSLQFIDTEQFQRLRDVKQLGLSHYVFPGAVHSRFEHSLGVYWLAGQAVQRLEHCQGKELGIEPCDRLAVKLAGLLHDVGHGPFSHVFENEFLPRVLPASLKWTHERMSVNMVDHIVDEHHIDIDSGVLRRVKEMIVASSKPSVPHANNEKRFLYDIVANGRNSIDVDKFDYLVRDSRACGLPSAFHFARLMQNMRVVDNEICYRASEARNIYQLFQTRADLFRTVYTHAKAKAIELMITDALVLANDFFKLCDQAFDVSEFWKLDDTILKTIEITTDPDLQEAKKLVLRIRRRELYQFCNEYVVPKNELEHFKDVTPQDIICSQTKSGINLTEEDIVVSNVKIDLTRGMNNPLDSVSFFSEYGICDKVPVRKEQISQMLPDCFQDRIVRVYSKKPELVEAVSEAFENFQIKAYGTKAQVHGTPESKKRRKHCRS